MSRGFCPVTNSVSSKKSLNFSLSLHVKHVEIIFVSRKDGIKKQFFHFDFLNINN